MNKRLCCALALVLALGLLTGCLGLDGKADVLPPVSGTSVPEDGSMAPAPPAAPGAASLPGTASASVPAPVPTIKLVVPEGFTLAKIGLRLEEMGVCTAAEFIAAAQTGDYSDISVVAQLPQDANRCFALEGYLFPATYEFPETVTPEEIIRKMLTTTTQRLTAELQAEIAASGYTLDQIITLASVIEKESFGSEAMVNVSSVFHNRMAQGIQLQSDVTIKYVEGAIKPFIDGDKDRYNEHYNTYKCPALPAGAICNPGMAAIQAAVRPASTPYLYFVTDKNNTFYFAETYEQHEAHIAQIKAAGLWG